MAKQPQSDLVPPEDIWKDSLLAKCRGLLPWRTVDSLERCGREPIYRTCQNCGECKTMTYKCSLKYCPRCNWRISRERAEILRTWSAQITQPKHVVLTARNFPILTRQKIRNILRAFAKLRRTDLFSQVKGGCVSCEITNEGRGWHVHLHILCDARFIPAGPLAITWGKLIGQDFGIVKVKDVRGTEYAHEVTKYVVKGSEIVTWDPEEIQQFVRSVTGIRMFTTFGTMFKLRREIRRQLRMNKPEATPCPCGCSRWIFETDKASVLREIRNLKRR